ncbi:MAG: ADP-ribosylglycohydrolase family protein, partial [Deltaproteobacteria bacterium]
APVPMFYAKDPREAIEKSGESSKTTHGAPAAIDACGYLGALIVGALLLLNDRVDRTETFRWQDAERPIRLIPLWKWLISS